MENEPDTTNVVYIDEYPELAKKVWLRRLAASRQMGQVISLQNLIIFPDRGEGDEGA
jgi:hypothetical protein